TCTMDPSLSEHALVVVEGRDIEVDDNRLECLEPIDPSPGGDPPFPPLQVASWGGLQVRGQSNNVQIRRNHILRGLGPGITLGSVVWAPLNQRPQSVRFGAGHGQIVNELITASDSLWRVTAHLVSSSDNTIARNPGFIQNIVISGNQIEQMGTNGISVLT